MPIGRQARTSPVFNNWGEADVLAAAHIRFDQAAPAPATARATDAMWLAGHQLVAPQGPVLILTTDTIPGDTTTTATLTVNAPSIISAIDTIGDEDYYQVTLNAGQTYEIGMYGYVGGPNLVPNPDSYVEVYNAAGHLIVSGDGGADTPLNQANSGFDVLLTYTPDATGTYYINARAFDQDPTNGTKGDSVGDYEIFVRDAQPGGYVPYYDVDSPLYAIDWGTRVNKVNQSDHNPDGNEGTRDTGNAQGTPVYTTAFDIPALAAAQGVNITGKNVITIYFAKAGDVFVSNDPTNPGLPPATITATGVQAYEHTAVMTALGEFAKVADIVYLEVQDRDQADFVYTSYAGTPGPGVSLLGSMSPPDESDEGLAQFNSADERWNALNLQQGGFSYVTLIHEFGHGHGLAHPHDNGGHSGIMNGVESEGVVADYTTGDFELNQSVFTMMSYEDGWQSSPYGNADTDVGYGYLGSLMAFDIAAIQDKYGVNEDYATGNDTYTLKDVNAEGTYFSSIWDGGGTDQIVYAGARDTLIDLRAATLQYEVGGGGRVSYAYGIYGGFTIANGVTIENATSGGGADILFGNAAANVLNGGAGADVMTGFAGNDVYVIDNNGDTVFEAVNGGFDQIYSSINYQIGAGLSVEVISANVAGATTPLNLAGNELDQQIIGNAGDNFLIAGGGADGLYGGLGNDTYSVDTLDVVFDTGGNDIIYSSTNYQLNAGAQIEILSANDFNLTTALNLAGNELDQQIFGNAGNNFLIAGAGADGLYGKGGNDTYSIDSQDVVVENAGEGFDIVYTSTSFTLSAGTEVEIVSANDFAATSAINLTGNELAQTLIGNAGANALSGGAGSDTLNGGGGSDSLTGGTGIDNFMFTTALGGGNVDSILDFSVTDDTIMLDDAVFAGLGLGALGASAFATGGAAADADDRIIYNSTTGALFFDADGTGAGAAVQFATLTGAPALSASDFLVI